MKLSTLLYREEYTSQESVADLEVSAVVSDTRALRRGVLFVCLRGTRMDSHTLVEKAEAAGAIAIVAEEGATLPDGVSIPVLRVKSTRRALALLHSRANGSPAEGMTMIGITGTNGKTSTATVLYSILRATGYRAALIGTAECLYDGKIYTLPEGDSGDRLRTMTTPDPDVLYPMLATMKESGITHVVMEVSSHALALEKVAPIRFEVGIFTNLSPEHMDFHGDMSGYLRAKARLFTQCETGVFNCDDTYADGIIRLSTCRILRAGVVWQGEYRATDVELRGVQGITYSLIAPALRLRVRTPLPGVFSVYNTLLALTAATALGVPPIGAVEAIGNPIRIEGRMERLPTDGEPFSVFIDYAHTERALRTLLTSVRTFRRANERIVLIFGCGGDRDKTKRAPMGRAAEELADAVYLTSDNPRSEDPAAIIEEIRAGMVTPARHRAILSRRKAIETAIHEAQEGDIILLCGKGHERYEIANGHIRPFDERKIVAAALEKRKKGDNEGEN